MKPKILVIDDEEPLLNRIRAALDHEYQVFTSVCEDEALKVFGKEKPPVVTLDLTLNRAKLADLGGLRLLKNFLSIDPSTRVIVVSGNSSDHDAVRAVQLGAFDYVLKPVRIDELKVIISRALHLSRLVRRAFPQRSVASNDQTVVTSADLTLRPEQVSYSVDLKSAKRAIEVDFIKKALSRNNGIISRAARDLGISRVSLYELIQRHNFRLCEFKISRTADEP